MYAGQFEPIMAELRKISGLLSQLAEAAQATPDPAERALRPIEEDKPCFKCRRLGSESAPVIDRWPFNSKMRDDPERFMHACGICPAEPDKADDGARLIADVLRAAEQLYLDDSEMPEPNDVDTAVIAWRQAGRPGLDA